MKIAITAPGPTLHANVDSRFGRCPWFLIVDTDRLGFEAVENPNLALSSGAGIRSAQLLAERDVEVVLTGNCGPKAYQSLSAAGIGVIVGCDGTVREAINQFKAGQLDTVDDPTAAGNCGADEPSTDASDHDIGVKAAFGFGKCCGGAVARMGRMDRSVTGRPSGLRARRRNHPRSSEELTVLKQRANVMSRQTQQIQQQIQELEREKTDGDQD
jgi:predicted Fe-Mo cluster-binding NifX family protein